MCFTLSPLVSLMYWAKCINPRVNNSPRCVAPKLKNLCFGTFRHQHLSAPFCTFRHRHFLAPFGTFRVRICMRIHVFAFVYVHVRHLGTSFRTSLYPVLSKNIALHKVYWRFIIHCICVYHVIVYLRLCICMSDSWQHPLGARFYWGRSLTIGGKIINNWGQGFIGGDH